MSRLVSLGAAVALVAALPGCKSTYRSFEGQKCSVTSSDDPFFVCSPSQDLVCINTYGVPVMDRAEFRPIYVCRFACSSSDQCLMGDTCCPGRIHGKTYGKVGGCVPTGKCDDTFTTDAGLNDGPTDDPDGGETDSL